jgi:hypothetical protein
MASNGSMNSLDESKSSVPHPCAFFLAQGWETTKLNQSSSFAE